MHINAEWYRVFLVVSKIENLSRSAEKLHMTQPSVSYIIKQLEESLGIALFERLSKGVRLTQEGKMLAEYVEKAFQQLFVAESQIHLLKQYKLGDVRIGANGAIIKDVVLPILDEFHNQYPDIRIRLLQDKTKAIIDFIKEGTLDAGFVYLPVKEPELAITPLKEVHNCFVVGRNFFELSKQPITTDRLAQIPLLLLSSGSTTRSVLEGWFASQGYSIKADFELNSLDMLIEFAKRGYGAAFVPESFIQDEIELGKLAKLDTLKPLPIQTLGMVTRNKTTFTSDIFTKMFLNAYAE